MPNKLPVIHALGNTIHQDNVKLTRNGKTRGKLILYKCVFKLENGIYGNLYGEEQHYELGKTYKKNHDSRTGFFLGSRDFVATTYFRHWVEKCSNVRVLECVVDVSSVTFNKKRAYRQSLIMPKKNPYLEMHEPHHEIQVNKFKVCADVTDHIVDVMFKKTIYSTDLTKYLTSTQELARADRRSRKKQLA